MTDQAQPLPVEGGEDGEVEQQPEADCEWCMDTGHYSMGDGSGGWCNCEMGKAAELMNPFVQGVLRESTTLRAERDALQSSLDAMHDGYAERGDEIVRLRGERDAAALLVHSLLSPAQQTKLHHILRDGWHDQFCSTIGVLRRHGLVKLEGTYASGLGQGRPQGGGFYPTELGELVSRAALPTGEAS